MPRLSARSLAILDRPSRWTRRGGQYYGRPRSWRGQGRADPNKTHAIVRGVVRPSEYSGESRESDMMSNSEQEYKLMDADRRAAIAAAQRWADEQRRARPRPVKEPRHA